MLGTTAATMDIKHMVSVLSRRNSRFSTLQNAARNNRCEKQLSLLLRYDDQPMRLSNPLYCQPNNINRQDLYVINQHQKQHQQQQVRYMGGTRGSRGHGWYINYRKNDENMNRHLQGEYYDRETLTECQSWNQSILDLGYEQVYMDIVVEPKQQQQQELHEQKHKRHKYDVTTLQGDNKFRLYINLASKIMPETTTNFIQLANEYKGTIFYRIEKNVGFCGGDVITNTGQTGKAALASSSFASSSSSYSKSVLRYDIQNDPLVLWHVPGTVSMIVSKVACVDSRFMICCTTAQHLDGIHRAFGQLTDDSLLQLQTYFHTTLTHKGKPTLYDFVIADFGIVDTNDQHQQETESNHQMTA